MLTETDSKIFFCHQLKKWISENRSNEVNREMKEDAYLSAMRMVKEAQNEGKVSADVLKQAFAHLKK